MIVKLLTEHHLEFLSLKGGCRGSSESTHVKMLEISYSGSYSIIGFVGRNADIVACEHQANRESAHSRSLISLFVIRSLLIMKAKLA